MGPSASHVGQDVYVFLRYRLDAETNFGRKVVITQVTTVVAQLEKESPKVSWF